MLSWVRLKGREIAFKIIDHEDEGLFYAVATTWCRFEMEPPGLILWASNLPDLLSEISDVVKLWDAK